MIALHSAGFSCKKKCDVPGTTASSQFRQRAIERQRVLEGDEIVIGDHHQRAVMDGADLFSGVGGLPGT